MKPADTPGRRLRASAESRLHRLWFSAHPGAGLALLGLAIRPLSYLTQLTASRVRARINQRRSAENGSARPAGPIVIIVGNLVAGGAGKTPLTIAIAQHLKSQGHRVGLLCRGGPKAAHQASLIERPSSNLSKRNSSIAASCNAAGDEALLLAGATGLPVAVAHRRAQALALLTVQEPAPEIVISDDGLQHEALRRDLELIVVDPRGLGNGHLLPSGPLREPADAMVTADAIIFNTGWQNKSDFPTPAQAAPIFRSTLVVRDVLSLEDYRAVVNSDDHSIDQRQSSVELPAPSVARLTEFANQSVAAVAGIANPDSFFALLEHLGLTISRYAPGDHAQLDGTWLNSLPEQVILMTEKDAVKCMDTSKGRIFILRIIAQPEPAFFDWLSLKLNTLGRSHDGPTHS